MFVFLFGQGILIGPRWAIQAANGLADVELASHERLLALSRQQGSRSVRRDPEAAAMLEAACSPGDIAEVGLAGAGYDTWQGTLAHIGVLTAPKERHRGHGLAAVLLAIRHAGGESLIPQWRVRTDNLPSRRTAVRAGFLLAASQTSVLLGPPAGELTKAGRSFR